jgi:Domain of unknown function (DUF4129)
VPSRADTRVRAAAMPAVMAAALLLAGSLVQHKTMLAQEGSPGSAEIAHALVVVKADPNLATERTIKMLRWKQSDSKSSGLPGWLGWIVGLFLWLEQEARLAIWCAAVILAGMLVVYIARIVGARGAPRLDQPFVAPTHVQDLDIRPETLPSDIGAAARALWNRGDHRASLALLYRGMLSRLAHVHGVPIHDSSTEGECLALAASHLGHRGHAYATRLVRVWQRAVYGREDVQTTIVHVLCDDFGPALDPTASVPSTVPGQP